MNKDKCQCSLAIRLCGDGCRYCQPQEHIDRLGEWLDEERKRLYKAQALIARQAEALRAAKAGITWWCEEYPDDTSGCDREMCNQIDAAISVSAKSVAAWEEAKLKPLQQHVAMLNKQMRQVVEHLNDAVYAENRAEGKEHIPSIILAARRDANLALSNTQATAEAHDREVAAKALEDAANKIHVRLSENDETVEWNLRDMAAELRAANKKGGAE